MRGFVLAAAVALAGCSPSAKAPDAPAAAPAVSPFKTSGLIYPEDRALELLNQCSRGIPEPVDGTWTPSATDIAELESRLMDYLREQRPAAYPVGQTPDLVRNYAGYKQKGRRIIYLDAAIAEPGLFGVSQADALPDKPFNSVCDGGPRFFGVEYDVEAKAFARLLENGPY